MAAATLVRSGTRTPTEHRPPPTRHRLPTTQHRRLNGGGRTSAALDCHGRRLPDCMIDFGSKPTLGAVALRFGSVRFGRFRTLGETDRGTTARARCRPDRDQAIVSAAVDA